jgi:hypothetical protein
MKNVLLHFSHILIRMSLLLLIAFLIGVPALADDTTPESASPSPAFSEPTFSPWPAETSETRPWGYWWWMGSAVNRTDITRCLELYQQAGMGGVHIIPIYGAKGFEDQYIEYLSPEWMAMLDHTVTEADRLGLGIDMTLGTGWCFGGPHISDEDADAVVVRETFDVQPGTSPEPLSIDPASVQAVVAFHPTSDECVILTDRIAEDGSIDWTAPEEPDGESWTLYVISQKPSGRRVKRAAPGGEGYMLNAFSQQAIDSHLDVFTEAFDEYDGAMPRSVYHDSYEYAGNWSPDLFAEFAERRGYQLETELPALFGEGEPDRIAGVRADYRRTISDMMTDNFTQSYVDWAHDRGMLVRNEAHGSPANLLDLYGAVDIPETEFFRFDRNPLVAKLSSSAAHTQGRAYTASETATWLDEHYHVTLGKLKPFIDGLFLSGVNQMLYHGTCYSPEEAEWPGWVFYASTQMNPQNSIWRDVPALNAYISRCQSVLQAGRPDSEILLYWPLEDYWHEADGLTKNMTVHHTEWIMDQPTGATARELWRQGYAFDYISDRQLEGLEFDPNGTIHSGNTEYQMILVPSCRHMSIETLCWFIARAHEGATIIFESIPEDVPGWEDLEHRREVLQKANNIFLKDLSDTEIELLTSSTIIPRRINVFPDPIAALEAANIPRETMLDQNIFTDENSLGAGLKFIRGRLDDGRLYFMTNGDAQFTDEYTDVNPIDEFVTLAHDAKDIVIMDPMTGEFGRANFVDAEEDGTQVYLQMPAGRTLIVRTYDERQSDDIPSWPYYPVRGSKTFSPYGPWTVEFIDGGPVLPAAFETQQPTLWTNIDDPDAIRFAGTACYATTFDRPTSLASESTPNAWELQLGGLHESARVRFNGENLGTIFAEPFELTIPNDLFQDHDNLLEIEVTNLSANRIRDLDMRGVEWRRFHDINFVDIDYEGFDATIWPVEPSGLDGPVFLWPLHEMETP